MVERMILAAALRMLRMVRWALQTDARLFMLIGAPSFQPLLAWIGRVKAFEVYLTARQRCPGYRQFLLDQKAASVSKSADLHQLPATTKENYVRKYSIEDRCIGGKIPSRGVVIDESSGSSGTPNSWVRGPAERGSVKTIMQLSYALMYDRKDFFILNCFALGPWATGMNVAMSLVDVAIMKSIGPDKAKLENALRQFGPQYRYLIAGYPPFIKNFVDTTTLNLREFELHLVVGGEGISEGLREYFQQWFKTIFSSYGASDLEINIGAETAFTIALRRLCWKDPRLSKSLFGREDPPMIFQYNPLDYYIEQNADGEAIFTLTRASNVAPKIRYNLHDRGGIYRHAELIQKMHELGVSPPPVRASSLPILFIYGRNDLSVPFYGCKVFTTDLDNIIYQDPLLARRVNSFQIENEENAQFDRLLHVHLEQAEGVADFADESYLHEVVFEGLKRVNQDFREISRMIAPAQVRVSVHRYGTGPFSGRDIRVKSRYVAGNS